MPTPLLQNPLLRRRSQVTGKQDFFLGRDFNVNASIVSGAFGQEGICFGILRRLSIEDWSRV